MSWMLSLYAKGVVWLRWAVVAFWVAVAGASSRYQTENVMAPAPDLAIALVRRVALNTDGQPIPVDDATVFSEMARYVLVRRDGKWWLAAGQNTPIRPKP